MYKVFLNGMHFLITVHQTVDTMYVVRILLPITFLFMWGYMEPVEPFRQIVYPITMLHTVKDLDAIIPITNYYNAQKFINMPTSYYNLI